MGDQDFSYMIAEIYEAEKHIAEMEFEQKANRKLVAKTNFEFEKKVLGQSLKNEFERNFALGEMKLGCSTIAMDYRELNDLIDKSGLELKIAKAERDMLVRYYDSGIVNYSVSSSFGSMDDSDTGNVPGV